MQLNQLMGLFPLLGLNIPPMAMKIGMKALSSGGVMSEKGLDPDKLLEAAFKLAKEDNDVAREFLLIGLRGMGVSNQAAALAADFAYNAPDGERTDDEYKLFTEQFRALNTPLGRIELPVGCKDCRRIHFEYSELGNDLHNPKCARCGRPFN